MNFRPLLLISVFALAGFAVAASPLHAQTSGIDLTPSILNPVPGQTVTITARSYSTNINTATVVWAVNGHVMKRGVGATTLDVIAPAIGKTLSIVVDATSPAGTSFENSIVISSGSVDIIVEPQGYVPPMFKGKIPFIYQGTATVIAVPHLANSAGTEYDPKSLVYKWEQGSNVLESQSGFGRQAITVTGSVIPRPIELTVTVSTRDGGTTASQSIIIAPTSPFILFYRSDPTYGPLYNLALGNAVYLGSQREVGVLAVPFGFDLPASGLGSVGLNWTINGNAHSELDQNESITLRAPADTAGTSNISLAASDQKNILQSATAAFQAVFSAASASGNGQQISF